MRRLVVTGVNDRPGREAIGFAVWDGSGELTDHEWMTSTPEEVASIKQLAELVGVPVARPGLTPGACPGSAGGGGR